MKIIADTASLIPPAEGEKLGLTVIPVSVAVDGTTYKDYEEITSRDFLRLIEKGAAPTSSQPAIGDILDVLESGDEDMVFLTVGDGLSGGYQTAMGARSMAEDPERIHIINSGTLAGPLHYLAKKALELKAQGLSVTELIGQLKECIESSVSFVIPEDFEFLRRSGRLTAMTARIGGALKLLPVLTQTRDRKRITPVSIKRSWSSAVDTVLQKLRDLGVGEGYLVSVCHAGTPVKARRILEQIKAQLGKAETEILELSPALITHGGPGCIVIQAIRK